GPITYSYTTPPTETLNPAPTFDPTTGIFNWAVIAPTDGQMAVLHLTVEATDSHGTVEQPVELHVYPPPPDFTMVKAANDQSVVGWSNPWAAPFAYIPFNLDQGVTSVDVALPLIATDGQQLTYTVTGDGTIKDNQWGTGGKE